MRRHFYPLLLWLALLLLGRPSVWAHPVSQNALTIEVHPDRVQLHMRVSTEEVFIAGALGAGLEPGQDGADSTWLRHARYVLKHVRVQADGQILSGRLLNVTEPGSLDNAAGAATNLSFARFDYVYPTAAPPTQLRIDQDVLREFDYAPGNPWDVTYVVRIEQGEQPPIDGLLFTCREPFMHTCRWNQPGGAAQASSVQQARLWKDYVRHGVLHILSGYDHLLFILALVLATVTLWDLVKVVSAFTLAHTLTLTLSVLGWVRLSSHVVEPMIAASIVFVALQNVFWPRQTRGWGRFLVAFFFGLFHGLGFAGGLLEAMAGLPGATVGIAIVAFSLGVEIGHQVVVLPVFAALKLASGAQPDEAARQRISGRALRYGSACISLAGMVYLIAALR